MIIGPGISFGGGVLISGPINLVSSGLVLYLDAANTTSYPGSGTTWYDLSGQSNDVTMQNSSNITYSSTGGGYFTLTSNGYFNKSSTTLSTGSNTYSMSAWIQLGATWGGQGIIGIGSSTVGNQTNQFRTTSTNAFVNYWYGNDYAVTTSLNPTTQWFNIVAQFDGTNRSIWLNGSQVGTQTASGLNVSSSLLQVGATNVGGSEPLQGKIGQALIYNRALTSTEISQNYSSVRTRYGV